VQQQQQQQVAHIVIGSVWLVQQLSQHEHDLECGWG
jgi:hypothetical protein